MISTTHIFSCCSLILLSTLQWTNAQELRPADSLQFAFGLSNFESNQVIIINYFEHVPPQLLFAAHSNGSLCEVSFITSQKSSETHSGRDIPENFAKMSGPVYKSATNCLLSGETTFVVSRSFLKSNKPLQIKALRRQLDGQAIRRIEAAKGFKTRTHWKIAEIPKIGDVALLIFEPRNDTILLTLALISETQLVFQDYPGDVNDESTTWRVDDGGEFDARAFNIIAAFESKEGVTLVTTWSAFEGESASVLLQKGNNFFRIGDAYRYWAPK